MMENKIIWYPNDFLLHHQWRFHNSKARIKILVGGWGCGKSLTTTIELINNMTIPRNVGFLGRFEIPELIRSVLEDIIFAYLPPDIYKHNTIKRTITFKGYRSTIVYSFLNPSKLKNKQMGGSYGVVCVDQMEEITEEVFEILLSRLRRDETNRVFLANANPNGKDWIYRRFIATAEEQEIKPSKRYFEEIVKKNPIIADLFDYETFPPYKEYINAKEASHLIVVPTWHNPFLPEDYIKSLLKLPEDVRKRYVDSEFTEFSGKIYTEFDERKHIYLTDKLYKTGDVYVAIDPAIQGTTAVLFACYDKDKIYVFDEIYVEKAYPHQIINKIREKLDFWEIEENKVNFIIDGASKKLYHSKDKSIYHEYVILNPLPKIADKLNLILNTKLFFYNNKILIHKRCENTIIEHNNYKWKASSSKEEPLKENDHTVDCLQYIVDEIRIKYDINFTNILTSDLQIEEDLITLAEDEVHERLANIRAERLKVMRELKRNPRPWRAV
ncbi:MAG: phage terminase large subunit [Candidatus Aenigmatarchaeota archaeon]